ncbi:MAG: HEAT repeat domain-containing protein [Anaerolineae bacterium]|nr:HEAT repeat domain-containing protein [Anaerolineae bacterium]
MRTLFISYKRDDRVAVTKISDRLQKDYYFDVWIDAVSIPGGEDWRVEIRKGIDKADVVLLMLTPDACASPQVKEEVDYAKSVGRKILPLQVKRVTGEDLEKLGVENLNYIDFVNSHDDHFAWDRLIASLPKVLGRDKRLTDPAFRKLHRDYLRSLFARHSKVKLTYLLDSTPRDTVSLFDIYVPLSLGLWVYGMVRDTALVDWWVLPADTERKDNDLKMLEALLLKDTRPRTFPGLEPEPSIVSGMIEKIQEEANRSEGLYGMTDGLRRVWSLESEDVLAIQSRLVITGDPGSGKSTLMRHLALTMAGDMLREGDEAKVDINQLRYWPHPAYTPIYIELRSLVRSAFPDLRDEVTLEKFFTYIEQELLKPDGLTGYLNDLRDQMRDGDAMIFLDGLDEVPEADRRERREQIKKLANDLRESYPECRIVVTSRPYAYFAEDWQLNGFGHVTLAALESERLKELANKLFLVVLGEDKAKQEAEQFNNQMNNVPHELRSSPLFFTLMSAIWLNNQNLPVEKRLPVTKGAIYRECVNMLIRRWTTKDLTGGQSLAERIGLTQGELRAVLDSLACRVHGGTQSGDDAVFESGLIMTTVREIGVKGVDYDLLLESLAQRAGVIYEKSPNKYQFAHRSFQEHLSASYLITGTHFPVLLLECVSRDPLLWRNVTLLAADLLFHGNRQSDLWNLLPKLFNPYLKEDIPQNREMALIAIEITTEHDLYEGDWDEYSPQRPVLNGLRNVALKIGGDLAISDEQRGMVQNIIPKLIKDQITETLIAQLKNSDSGIRSGAAWMLSQYGNATAVDPLIQLLQDQHIASRAHAAQALGAIAHPRAVDLLIEKLNDAETAVRAKAAVALGSVMATGEPRAFEGIQNLVDLLKDDNVDIQRSVLGALYALNSDSYQRPDARYAFVPLIDVESFKDILEHENVEIRELALKTLADLAQIELVDAQSAIQRLFQYIEDENNSVRAAALNALSNLRFNEKILESLRTEVKYHINRLGNILLEDRHNSTNAVNILGCVQDSQVVELLIQALQRSLIFDYQFSFCIQRVGIVALNILLQELDNYQTPRVTAAILMALANLNDRAVLAPVIKCTSNVHPGIRMEAAKTLGWLGAKDQRSKGNIKNEDVPKIIESLILLLNDKDSNVRSASASSIGQIGGGLNAIDALVKLLTDKDEWVRSSAIFALGEIGVPSVIGALSNLLHDENYWVRMSVVSALGKLGKQESRMSLRGALDDKDRDVILSAASGLAEIGDTGYLIDLALNHSNISTRNSAMWRIQSLLAKQPEYIQIFQDPLLQGLLDVSSAVRMTACYSLGTVSTYKSIEPLIKCVMHDNDTLTRTWAVDALEKISAKIEYSDDVLNQIRDSLFDAFISSTSRAKIRRILNRFGRS